VPSIEIRSDVLLPSDQAHIRHTKMLETPLKSGQHRLTDSSVADPGHQASDSSERRLSLNQ
jgi:hypothetical protein